MKYSESLAKYGAAPCYICCCNETVTTESKWKICFSEKHVLCSWRQTVKNTKSFSSISATGIA